MEEFLAYQEKQKREKQKRIRDSSHNKRKDRDNRHERRNRDHSRSRDESPPPPYRKRQRREDDRSRHKSPTQKYTRRDYRGDTRSTQQLGGNNDRKSKTLYIGDLDSNMDENYLNELFKDYQISNIKIMRDRHTGKYLGYGFIEFKTRESAQKALEQLSGKPIKNTRKIFKLNWSQFMNSDQKRNQQQNEPQTEPQYAVFVGDLAPEVTDFQLLVC